MVSIQASPVPTWEPGYEANSRLLQTRLSTEQPSLIVSQARVARETTLLTGDTYRLVQGSFLSPIFHSILCNHQLPHTLLFSLSSDSNGICLFSKWLVEVVQTAAGLDSGNENSTNRRIPSESRIQK